MSFINSVFDFERIAIDVCNDASNRGVHLLGVLDAMHPWMLFFMFAVLIPILIHYWNRKNHERISWAATHYLELALKKAAQRISFNQILLLLLRVIVIALVALALWTPFSDTNLIRLESQKQKTRLHVMLVDSSLSMNARFDASTYFELASDEATRIVSSSRSTDAFVLFTFDDRLSPTIELSTADKSSIVKEIDLLNSTLRSTNLNQVFQELSELPLLNQPQDYDELTVHLISDFVAKDWDFRETPELAKQWSEFTESFHVVTHGVADSDLSNNCIASFYTPESPLIQNQPAEFRVEVANFGGTSDQSLLVELLENQQLIGSKSVSLAAGQNQTVRFNHVPTQVGQLHYSVRIGEDALVQDNQRFLTCEVRERYEVLVVEGRPGSAKYLKIALDPESRTNSRIQFKTCDAQTVLQQSLDRFDVIILDNVRELKAGTVNQLRQFAASGKVIVQFLGDQVDQNRFNQLWLRSSEDVESLGIELIKTQPVENYRIDPQGYQSPIVSAFRGNPAAGLVELPIWIYVKAKVTLPEKCRVDLRFENGDPLLITSEIGRGKCIVFTSSSSSLSKDAVDRKISWNANETLPAFPALVQEIFSFARTSRKPPQFLVGQEAVGTILMKPLVRKGSLRNPAGDSHPFEYKQKNGMVAWKSEVLNSVGVHRISLETSQENTVLFSSNVDAAESDLRIYNEAEELTSDSSAAFETSESRHPYWTFQLLLLTATILFLAESYVALAWGKSK